MECSLGRELLMVFQQATRVLILILMECSLGLEEDITVMPAQRVLILILMECSLGESIHWSDNQIRES